MTILTHDTFITDVKRRSFTPQSSNTFTDADIVAFANEECQGDIMSQVTKLNEEYNVVDIDIALVADKYHYRIPERSHNQTIRDIYLVQSSGTLRPLSKMKREEIHYATQSDTEPYAYFLEGNHIRLLPTSGNFTSSLTLRVTIEARPNNLTADSRHAVISSFTANSITTVATIPGTFGATSTYDIIDHRSGNFFTKIDVTSTAASGTAMTFAADTFDLSADIIEEGNYVSLAKETPVIMLPEEFHHIVAERTAGRMFKAIGDYNGMNASFAAAEDMFDKLSDSMNKRNKSKPQKIISRENLLRKGTASSRRSIV